MAGRRKHPGAEGRWAGGAMMYTCVACARIKSKSSSSLGNQTPPAVWVKKYYGGPLSGNSTQPAETPPPPRLTPPPAVKAPRMLAARRPRLRFRAAMGMPSSRSPSICTYIFIHIRARTHARTHARTQTNRRTHTHTHTHTHTQNTHTHTHTWPWTLSRQVQGAT